MLAASNKAQSNKAKAEEKAAASKTEKTRAKRGAVKAKRDEANVKKEEVKKGTPLFSLISKQAGLFRIMNAVAAVDEQINKTEKAKEGPRTRIRKLQRRAKHVWLDALDDGEFKS
jgi:hypothetical protein